MQTHSKSARRSRVGVLLACAAAMGLVVGCDDDREALDGGPGVDASGHDAGPEGDGGPDRDGGPPPAECPSGPLPALTATPIADGFVSPIFLAQAPGRDDVLFVLEQRGLIRIVRDGAIDSTPFLDITDRVSEMGERGLLGLAFHPDYEANGRFFVFYAPSGPRLNVVAEYQRASPDAADPNEVRRLMAETDPFNNHNGGMLAFGPDGYLYVGTGDGGSGGDPQNLALNPDSIFGKILRLDVDAEADDFAAPGNPFIDGGGLPQIWAIGARNPWRFSFDRETDELYIGDVGQSEFEEVSVLPFGVGGANLGWSAYEGFEVFNASRLDQVDEHWEPIFVEAHNDPLLAGTCSITGGYVYRGDAIPALRGTYIYGDWCSRQVGAFRYCDGEVYDVTRIDGLENLGRGLASFGEDHDGELYLLYQGSNTVLRLEAP